MACCAPQFEKILHKLRKREGRTMRWIVLLLVAAMVYMAAPPWQGSSRAASSQDDGPIAVARRDPQITRMIAAASARVGSTKPPTETAVSLGGGCGVAGCAGTTLVVFEVSSDYLTNRQSDTVLALVSCGPSRSQGCSVTPAEVRPKPA